MARFRRRNASQPAAEKEDTKTVFVPTVTNIKLCFSRGSSKDAAGFEECKNALITHVGSQAWNYVTDISRGMRKLVKLDPEEWAPDKPIRYYTDTGGNRTVSPRAVINTDGVITEGEAHTPEEEDWEWALTIAVYGDAKRAHIKRVAAWKENNGKAFQIVASHCPSEVMAELRNQPDWTEIEDSNDVIGLLLLVRDLSQNKTSDKQGTIALVENDLTMYTTAQTILQTIEEYLAEFQANREAIIAHGGNPGYLSLIHISEPTRLV